MQFHFTRPIASLSILAVLAACGGSNNGSMSNPTQMPGQNKPLLEALQADNQALFQTPVATLPASGGADYTGYAQLALNGATASDFVGEAVGIAELRVDVTAGNPSLSGTMTDFDDRSGTYDGTLTVTSDGSGMEAGRTVANANVTGTLTRNTGQVAEIDADIVGRFFGDDATYLVGGGEFDLEYDGDTLEAFLSINATSGDGLPN